MAAAAAETPEAEATMKNEVSPSQKSGTSDVKMRLRTSKWLCVITLLLAAVLLFARLGHYALWDDEAGDALEGKAVMQSGDTRAMVGHNINAYRNGLMLRNLRVEGQPPFNAYIAAASMKILGTNSLAARLPSAFCGWGCVGVVLWWMWKWKGSPVTVAVFAIALLCNVSFFLYSRQCHYYGPSMFFFAVTAFLYLHWRGNRWILAVIGICSALQMASNYAFFVVLYGCLFADYFVWQRKVQPFKIADLAVLFAPSLVMGLILLVWWNPFHTQIGHRFAHDTILQRITLFFWHWRDLNRSEMILGVLLLFTPWIAFTQPDAWLRRGLLALALYAFGMTVLSTQTISDTTVSDVRYFSAILPLFIAVEVFTLLGLTKKMTSAVWVAIPLAAVAFGTNLLHGGCFFAEGLRSTLACFAGELWNPPADPYCAAAQWINENVQEGESIWVSPDYMVYPLIFHAPKAVYAWQLPPTAKTDYAGLPPIHFQGIVPPDRIIAFGPYRQAVLDMLRQWQRADYQPEAVVNVYWKDLYRPELFWRRFEPVREFNPDTEAIYILKRARE